MQRQERSEQVIIPCPGIGTILVCTRMICCALSYVCVVQVGPIAMARGSNEEVFCTRQPTETADSHTDRHSVETKSLHYFSSIHTFIMNL